MKKLFDLSNVTLLVALFLSTIAAWFAIVGLVSIFPAKATSIIVMGSAIEVGKIITAIWLRKYWHRADWLFKVILVPMVGIMMILTSMGTFGFLSSAHSEQNAVSGDITSKVALIDEKIKVQRDNISAARAALAQLDMQVNNVMIKGDSEKSAARSVQIRRQQTQERNTLQKEIEAANITIAKLNEERAPIASQLRKVEAEVGPIKYIAALIYGDNPSADILEKSVRWVIILLVIVFDPLAIALVLAGNASKKWDAEDSLKEKITEETIVEKEPEVKEESITKQEEKIDTEDDWEERISKIEGSTPWPTEWNDTPTDWNEQEKDFKEKDFDLNDHPYLFRKPNSYHPPGIELATPQVYVEEKTTEILSEKNEELSLETNKVITEENKVMEEVSEKQNAGWSISNEVFKNFERDFLNGFGNSFPNIARKGAIFVRTDHLPHKIYKFNGSKWIEVDKHSTDTYIHNESYLKFLIEKIGDGTFDPEFLTDYEKECIEYFLKKTS